MPLAKSYLVGTIELDVPPLIAFGDRPAPADDRPVCPAAPQRIFDRSGRLAASSRFCQEPHVTVTHLRADLTRLTDELNAETKRLLARLMAIRCSGE